MRRPLPTVVGAGIVAVVLAALALLVSAAATTPGAAATPNKQKVCSSCHSGAPSGSVTAVPSNATPAPGASYNVAISIGLSSSGQTGFWIADSDAAAATGATTGVFGGPGLGTSWNPTMTAPATPGTYYYKVWCVKGPDNSSGQAKAATYSITVASPPPPTDGTAPTTTASGATDNGWYHLPTLVTLTATDGVGGSGVATLAWTLDGGLLQSVADDTAPVTVPAPAGGAADGPHTIVYHATDVAANAESPKTLTVNIDTMKPTAKALAAASVRRGHTATLTYQVDDSAPNGGTAKVTIKIKDRGGKVVKTFRLGARPIDTPLAKKFTCTLAKGTYKYLVYGTDTAGNAQATVGVNKLVVK